MSRLLIKLRKLLISSVNYAKVVGKLSEEGMPVSVVNDGQ